MSITTSIPNSPIRLTQAGEQPEASLPPMDTSIDLSFSSEASLGSQDDLTSSFMTQPDSGLERHPKGRRKRTGAQDKVVLEEAYQKNPKPDKAARLDIVERVSLSEKEVQIWFQNRRQNDRRKSRPLSALEIAALRYNGVPSATSDPPSSQDALENAISMCSSSEPTNPHNTRDGDEHEASEQSLDTSFTIPPIDQNLHTDAALVPVLSQELPPSQSFPASSHGLSHSFSHPVGYFANRRNLANSFFAPLTANFEAEASQWRSTSLHRSNSLDTVQPARRPRAQSIVRLSLSLDGKAELIPEVSSPEPKISQQIMLAPDMGLQRQPLHRSHSTLPTITLPPISTLTGSLPPRMNRGRARDVNAWESCADLETRDELMTQAENESNGSAVAAINLLRSTSGNSHTNAAKRNASVAKTNRAPLAKKAKLGRTNSSMARLESIATKADKLHKFHSDKMRVSMLVSPTDSDKENWSPDEDGNAQDLRHQAPPALMESKTQNPRRLGRILQQQRPSSLNGRANTAPVGKRNLLKEGIEIFDDGDGSAKPAGKPRVDDVENFMRGEVSPSKKGDMDCIAGLLSLSQGAWR